LGQVLGGRPLRRRTEPTGEHPLPIDAAPTTNRVSRRGLEWRSGAARPEVDHLLMTKNSPRMSVQVLHHAATLAGALLAYYFFPITGESSALWQLLLFGAGLALLIWWIIREFTKQLTAGSNPRVGVHSLITLLYPVVALFALAYFLIQHVDPTQFDGLVTRTDALYYTIITLGTIGYGDVNAVGQFARIITMIQVAFDLVVIGAFVAIASSRVQILFTQRSVGSGEPNG
jgi:hypothetical protein